MPRSRSRAGERKSSTAEKPTPEVMPELPPPDFPRLHLPIQPPFPPMEAKSARELPESREWLYEPKWDGFRCLAFRSGKEVVLQSKAGQPLTRYFPELVEAFASIRAEKFVFDGEIVVEIDRHLDFNALLQRIHPAPSRVRRLSIETPAQMFCFDLLVDEKGKSLATLPLLERKERLADFYGRNIVPTDLKGTLKLGRATEHIAQAREWMTELAAFGCDGVVAKLKDAPYHSADREGMVKVKRIRTADCVLGGFRYAQKKQNGVGSILLGLYNDAGQLNHVGFCSSFTAEQRKTLAKRLEALVGPPGFTGKAPGGPSRWNQGNDRSTEWESLKPELVCEVQYDHFSNGRFRHGTKFLRWRPEKSARTCTYEQLKMVAVPKAKAS
jgi:ATP-dependent DNA ligase